MPPNNTRSELSLRVSTDSIASVRDFSRGVKILNQTLTNLNKLSLGNNNGLAKLGKELKGFSSQLPTVISQIDQMAKAIGRISGKGVNQAAIFDGNILRGQVSATRLQNFKASDATRAVLKDELGTLTNILRVEKLRNKENRTSVITERARLKTTTDIASIEGRQLNLARKLREAQNSLVAASGQREAGLKRQITFIKNTISLGNQRIELIKKGITLEQQRERAVKKTRQEEERVLKIKNEAATKLKQLRQNAVERVTRDGGAGLLRIQNALLINFAILGSFIAGIRNAITFAIELDKNLRNLQAITVTSEGGLLGLRDSLVAVSEATKFTANEVALASVVLGQAGLTVSQIEASIKSVTLLAAATGSDLSKAVDLVTATLGVFNIAAEQTSHVANTLTAAVNQSKLTLDKLALGLQFSGNIAAQSNVNFEELTAALGAMANAGIRSGSTLGTGTRQVLISLQKPSERFREILDRLGLTIQDVSVRSKGLEGVLNTLKDAGFTANDAIEAFEIRAAAAFNALAANSEDVGKLRLSFLRSTAAAKANETQMKSLANQYDRLRSVLGTAVETGLRPMLILITNLTEGFADAVASTGAFSGVIKTLTQSLAYLITGLIVIRLSKFTAGMVASQLASIGFGRSLKAGAGALAIFRSALGPISLAVAGIAAAIALFRSSNAALTSSLEESGSQLEKARTATEEAQGQYDKFRDQIDVVTGRIVELTEKHQALTKNTESLKQEIERAARQFGAMGLDVLSTVETVDDLVSKLRALRDELLEEYIIKINVLDNTLGAQRIVTENALETLSDSLRNSDLANVAIKGHLRSTLDPNLGLHNERTVVNYEKQFAIDREKLFNVLLEQGDPLLARGFKTVLPKALRGEDLSAGEPEILKSGLTVYRSPEIIRDYGNLITATDAEQLNKFASLQQHKLNLIDQQSDLDTEREVKTLQKTPAFSAIIDEITKAVTTFPDRLNTRIKDLGIQNDDEAVRDETLKISQRELSKNENLRQELQLIAERNSNNPEVIKEALKQGFELLAQGDSRGKRFISDTNERASATSIEKLKLDNKRDERQIAYLQNINKISKDPKQVLELSAQISELAKQINARKEQIFKTPLTPSQLATGLYITRLQAIQEEGAYKIAQLAEIARKDYERSITALNNSARIDRSDFSRERSNDFFRDIEQEFTDTKGNLAFVKKGPSELTEAKSQLQQISSNRFKGQYSQVQRDDLKDQIEKLDLENLKRVDTALTESLQKYDELFTTLDVDFEAVGERLVELRAKNKLLVGDDFATNEEKKAVQAEIALLVRDETKITAKKLKIEKEITKTQREQANVRQEIGIGISEPLSILDGFEKALRKIGDSVTPSVLAIDGFKGVVEGLNGAFTNLFTGIADGSTNAVAAMKNFAKGILQAIQQVIAKMIALYIIQKLTGLALGFSGGGSVTPGAGAGTNSPGLKGGSLPIAYNFGGEVKKFASGGGHDLGRDSVHALLRPGEFILRNSAVKAIGTKRLEEINALGNRVISNGVPNIMSADEASNGGGGGIVNVFVVSPDQQPVPGPKDIVAIIGDNISRGGAVKKLIKSVQIGNV